MTEAESREPFLVRHRYLTIILIGVVMYVAWLGMRDFWYPDEPDIAEVAQVMFLSGDWILPLRMGEPWVDYPPFLYWAGCAVSHAMGGVSEFAFRLPSALAAVILALATCLAATRLYDRRTGLWAGVLLMTFTQYVYNAVAFRPDMLFALFIGVGTFLYAAGVREEGRWGLRLLAFVCYGFAILVKGPLGVLLPGLVLTLWHAARREWARLFALAPLGLVSLLVAAPWYLAVADAWGAENLWREIRMQNFERWGEGVRYQGHIRPFYYYFVNIWADLAPWCFLLPFALVWTFRQRRWRRPDVQLWLFAVATWIGFLTLAATKRQLYLLPIYPFVALLLAPYVAAIGRAEVGAPGVGPARFFVRSITVLLTGAGVFFVVAAFPLEPILRDRLEPLELAAVQGLRWPLVGTGLAMIALGLWIGRAAFGPSIPRALGRSAAALVVVWALLLGAVLPALDVARTYRPQSAWIRAEIGDAPAIGMVYPERGRNKRGAFGYYGRMGVDLLDTEAEVEAFFAANPGSLVLLHEKTAEAFFGAAQADWRDRVTRDLSAGRRRYLVLQLP